MCALHEQDTPFRSFVLDPIIQIKRDTIEEKRGGYFFSIYCKTQAEAEKIDNEVYLYLRDKLKLPINRAKSGIRRPLNFKILGHGFVSKYKKGEKGKYQVVVKQESWETLKRKLKYATKKTLPKSLPERIEAVKLIYRGWINNFRLGNIQGK